MSIQSVLLVSSCGAKFSITAHIVDPEIVQSLGDLNLLSSIEEGTGELLALSKGTLNNLEVRHIAWEVAHTGVRVIPPVDV